MIHLIKHTYTDSKFDIAMVINGQYIFGSKKHYSRKSSCYALMRNILKQVGFGLPKHDVLYFQDDTLDKPEVYFVSLGTNGIIKASKMKPSRKFIPYDLSNSKE
jgi:hypothetical protein